MSQELFRRSAGPDLRVRRASVGLAAFALLTLAGCKKPVLPVYVDLDAAIATETVATPITLGGTAPARADQGRRDVFKLPSLPAISGTKDAAARAQEVRNLVAAERLRMQKTLEARLRAAYLREADALRKEKLDAFEPTRQALVQAALDKISQAYLAYADKKGPKVASLAVQAGFPDPDPQSKKTPDPRNGFATLLYGKAVQVRKDIHQLDADFKRYSEDALKQAGDEADARLTDLLAEIATQVADVDRRAREAADRLVKQSAQDLRPLLADTNPLSLPAVPETQVTLEPGPVVPPEPKLIAEPVIGTSAEIRRRVQGELTIWLKLNRYRLASKGRARDATQEFEAWRQTFRSAPSAPPSATSPASSAAR